MIDVVESAARKLRPLLESALARSGRCIFLTGAGVSAESGVPTFRGEEGYWRVGSRNYRAQELATRAAFEHMPEAVWGWYLHRRRVCAAAQPNVAHISIVEAAATLSQRFLLITQNVDGLHRRAGSAPETTYEVHGNISYMRCSVRCEGVAPLPEPAELASLDPASGSELRRLLRCASCGALTRPHVLWFDELYDEPLYRLESSRRAAADAALLVVVGTTGSTNLPLQIGAIAARHGTPLLVINPEPNPFSELAAEGRNGLYLQGKRGVGCRRSPVTCES